MTPEIYVIGSVVLSVLVVALMYLSPPMGDSLRCPRCKAKMQGIGSDVLPVIHVVPGIQMVMCLQCGYAEEGSTFRVDAIMNG